MPEDEMRARRIEAEVVVWTRRIELAEDHELGHPALRLLQRRSKHFLQAQDDLALVAPGRPAVQAYG